MLKGVLPKLSHPAVGALGSKGLTRSEELLLEPVDELKQAQM